MAFLREARGDQHEEDRMERTLTRLSRHVPALRRHQEGRWGYILAWLVGVPIPILLLVYFLRGCT